MVKTLFCSFRPQPRVSHRVLCCCTMLLACLVKRANQHPRIPSRILVNNLAMRCKNKVWGWGESAVSPAHVNCKKQCHVKLWQLLHVAPPCKSSNEENPAWRGKCPLRVTLPPSCLNHKNRREIMLLNSSCSEQNLCILGVTVNALKKDKSQLPAVLKGNPTMLELVEKKLNTLCSSQGNTLSTLQCINITQDLVSNKTKNVEAILCFHNQNLPAHNPKMCFRTSRRENV